MKFTVWCKLVSAHVFVTLLKFTHRGRNLPFIASDALSKLQATNRFKTCEWIEKSVCPSLAHQTFPMSGKAKLLQIYRCYLCFCL